MNIPLAVWFWLIGMIMIGLSWSSPYFSGLFWLGVVSAVVGFILAFLRRSGDRS